MSALPEPGDIVPFTFSPGIVVASFIASFFGAITTVELLYRRTNVRGWHRWVEHGACALSMGLVAIWCMHYIGNRAIVLGDGSPNIQLVYSGGFTALSSFIPVVAVAVALWIPDLRYHGRKSRATSLTFSGIMAGLAAVAMHYTGNAGVSNYRISFNPTFVGGAIVIACVAMTAVMFLIFKLQDLWLNTFKWRCISAFMIAGAISGMHFEASVGTTYVFKHTNPGGSASRNRNVIIAAVMSFLTIPVCIGIFLFAQKRKKQVADRAQQVVLACAHFDTDGRIMVTREGTLPSQKITVHHNHRSFEDEFNVSHPAFQWIFRASNNWDSIARWLPGMRRHLEAVHRPRDAPRSSVSTDSSELSWSIGPEDEDYSVIFRESFCVAAALLAHDLKEPLRDMGTLFDGVMTSGSCSRFGMGRGKNRRIWQRSTPGDLEAAAAVAASDPFGKGQVLFLAKRTDRKDIPKFQSMGYRFLPIGRASTALAPSLQVPDDYVEAYLSRVKASCLNDLLKKPLSGTLLTCFVLKAGINKRSWEVLVQKDRLHRLPWVRMWSPDEETCNRQYLAQLDGLTVAQCLGWIDQRVGCLDDKEDIFCRVMRRSIQELALVVEESFFRQAMFSARPVRAPTGHHAGSREFCTLYAFHLVPNVHSSALRASSRLTYTPLSFFKCRQQILERAPRDTGFHTQVHQEFASLFAGRIRNDPPPKSTPTSRRESHMIMKLSQKHAGRWPLSGKWSSSGGLSLKSAGSDDSSGEGGTYDGSHRLSDKSSDTTMLALPYGGIMVSSDVTVESTPRISSEDVVQSRDIADMVSGTRGQASMAEAESPTFVDGLFNVTVARWAKN